MKTKTCPYCGKELSGEAVLCKYCHNLLIDEDGNMTADDGLDDGRTKVFKKPDDDMTKRFVLPENAAENKGRGKSSKAVIADADADDVFPDSGFDDYDDDDDFDDGYDDYYDENAARKRLFIITAVVTIGVLVIVIAAILIGMRIIGKSDNGGAANPPVAAKPANSAAAEQDNNADNGQPADNNGGDTADNNTQPVQSTDSDAVQLTESAAASDSQTQLTESGAATDDSSQSDSDSSAINYADPTGSSSTDSNASSQAGDSSQEEIDISELENKVRQTVAGEINGDITGSQFRTEENGYAYYYFFTDNGAHGYSVAYNTTTGDYVCEQNY